MFTPKTLHYPATSNPDQILVSGVDENGQPVNAPIIIDAVLAQQLRETPATIRNPEYQAFVDEAFEKAATLIAEQAELLK